MTARRFVETLENFNILRQRLRSYIDANHPVWGAGKLLKATAHAHGQMPEVYRSALNKFIKGQQQRIDIKVASALWVYMIDNDPDSVLNSHALDIDLSVDPMSHALREFFDVDRAKGASMYAPSLAGEFTIIQPAWNRNHHMSVGRLKFTIAEGSGGHVLRLDEWSSHRPPGWHVAGSSSPGPERSTGYVFHKGTNILALLKTGAGYPKFVVIDKVDPIPQKTPVPFHALRGSLLAAIGQGPHYSHLFAAHRIETEQVPPEICTREVDDEAMDEFGHYDMLWLREAYEARRRR